ncbi:hypothetical protein L6164_029122 [Bauhinia variegata]|uniref:Uncharacterized protein n=1 Tax=Bauhinia variegata TaxID=167791 RepID=A0ACB9L818_BAUVA|nr:hypothetical protein L6164_029122 [Bauhinia variegata]
MKGLTKIETLLTTRNKNNLELQRTQLSFSGFLTSPAAKQTKQRRSMKITDFTSYPDEENSISFNYKKQLQAQTLKIIAFLPNSSLSQQPNKQSMQRRSMKITALTS